VHVTGFFASRSHQPFWTMPCTAGTVPVLTLAWPAQVTVLKYG
jgi:hypothetical protein